MPNDYFRHTPISGSTVQRPPLVLLVEDDTIAVEMFRIALTANNAFEVLHAADAEQAIEHLHLLSAIECVVTDVNLPGADGFEVLRASKMLRPQTPVLLVTASTSARVPTQAIREGADELLMKPVDLEELRACVTKLVARAQERRVAQARTVLAIGAHPDDVEIGIAGTLLNHIASGDQVIHLMMTDGESGGNREERIAEAEKSAEAMGIRLVRGSQPDGFLSDTREIVNVVAEAIKTYNPSVVYSHSIHDGHQDHRATFNATISGARGVPTLCSYQSPSATVDFRPSRFVDIGAHLDRKIELINIYRSQTSTRLYLAEDMIRATARYWGRHAAHRVVEPLEVVWQLTP